MAYSALANGVRGILFYTYSEPKWKLKEHAQLWTAVERLAVEVREDAPIFEHRVKWFPLETNHHGTEMYNEISEARMAVSMYELNERRGDLAPGFYFCCVNTGGEALEFSFKLPFKAEGNVRATHSNEEPVTDGNWVRKKYGAYEAVVYGPVQPIERPRWIETE